MTLLEDIALKHNQVLLGITNQKSAAAAVYASLEVTQKQCTDLGLMLVEAGKGYTPPPVIVDPPVIIDPPPIVVDPGGTPGTYPSTYGKKIPADVPGAKICKSYMQWGNWWPDVLEPTLLPTDLKGTWYGYNTGVKDPQTGQFGTLWFVNAYNVHGLLEDIHLWGIGDFTKGREGHGFYIRPAPHLNTKIRNCTFNMMGAQAVQREWRDHETSLPVSLWGAGGGAFELEDCKAFETGLIDEVAGTTDYFYDTKAGEAVRASWAYSLYNTMQRTYVRRCVHVNAESPAPHEGSLYVGQGQSNYRTPILVVDACEFYTKHSDRADIMIRGCDDATIRDTKLLGSDPWIDVANDCKKVQIVNLPYDCVIREKAASNPHGPPVKVTPYKKMTTLELVFP